MLTLLLPFRLSAKQSPSPPSGRAPPLVVPRVAEGSIVLDGIPDEPAWNRSEPLSVTMFAPTFGGAPSQRTEFRLLHDDENLYFSCRNYDSHPDSIQNLSLERDVTGWHSDNCGLFLDTFDDEENALAFVTWPGGNRTDFAITNDGEAPLNTDWNGFWRVATSRDGSGWYAEFRIPFSSLLFKDQGGRVVMVFAMMRNLARNDERIIHPAVPPHWGSFSFSKPSQMGKLILEGKVRKADPAYVIPYLLVGERYTHPLNASGSGYERESRRISEVGVDLRYELSANLNLDLSYNTDFAQVEADDEQVNLTRFSLFFPEKRRFFQERASTFEYSLGGQERLFHTRRIGLVQGQMVPIYGGARLVGRVGAWDVGLLDMQTESADSLPSENFGVLRLRRQVLNDNSYVGGILTSRWNSAQQNLVYGADALMRTATNDYLTLDGAQSFDIRRETSAAAAATFLDRSLLRLNWQRRGQDYWTYMLEYSYVGRSFNPKMGFLRRSDYTKGVARTGYGWRPSGDSPLLRYSLSTAATGFWRNATGALETGVLSLKGQLETKSSHQITVTVPVRFEDITKGFSLSPTARIPMGSYHFTSASVSYRAPPRRRFQPKVTVSAGQFYDGRELSITLDPTWRLSRHLTLGGAYELDHVTLPVRSQTLTAHIARLRTKVLLSDATSIAGLAQYNSAADRIALNLRFRFNPREGEALYVVWNEGLIADRFASEPVRPFSDHRDLMIKYTHALQFGL